MNINVSIIDQQVRGLAARLRSTLEEALASTLDDDKARSVSFVVLCVKVMLDLTEDEAVGALTEGGNDFGVDAIDVGDVVDGEFTVTLVQGKYSHQNLEGTKAFPQVGVEKAVQAVGTLFNPHTSVVLNPRLHAQIEEIRSLILDGNIPRVRVLLCNNGVTWKQPESQDIITRAAFGDRVRFEHVNHDVLIKILQSTTPVRDTLQFAGKAIVEDFNYARILLGRLPVTELARLMDAHGDRLLERNIRRYLGLHGNRVNEDIRKTLTSEGEQSNFYFYNNGVTLICDRFDYNALQNQDHKVRVEGLQIINGGQTSKTIQATLEELRSRVPVAQTGIESAFVLARLYQVPQDASSFVQTITYATNSQNPVDLKDLRSGDDLQKRLELSIEQLGYNYRRQRAEGSLSSSDISVGAAAEAVLAVWRAQPHQAKFRSGDRFGKLYGSIFTPELTGAQVVTAVLVFRIAENKRKRPPPGSPDFIRYASYFVAMLMGRYLLHDLGLELEKLDHREFPRVQALLESNGEAYFSRASGAIERAIAKLYGQQQVPLLQLSATFRRGDLFQYLNEGT
jgi:hypothetical protein